MAEHDDFDLDLATARAWGDFQQRLAVAIEGMTDEDTMVVEVLTGEEPEDGSQPYVQFAGFGGDHVRGEVSGNRFLAPAHRLDAAQEAYLVAQGWVEDEYNHHVHLPRAEGSRLAAMTVRALRDVFDVPHPAFLGARGPRTADVLGLVPPVAEVTPEVPVDEPLAVVPTDRDSLVDLVDAALTPYFGHPPRKDSDGDIPVRHRSSLVFVRVDAAEPIVHLFSFVVRDVSDLDAARVEVGILNRDTRFITFVAVGDAVIARIELLAQPFVPRHLRKFLHLMTTVLDGIDDDLALRTGGRPALTSESATTSDDPAPAPRDEETSAELAAIADRLERGEQPGGLDHLDEAAVDRLRRAATERELAERTSQEAASILGETDARARHEREAQRWRSVAAALARLRSTRDESAATPGAAAVPVSAYYQEFWTGVALQVHALGWTTAKPPSRHWWSLPAGVGGAHWSMAFTQFGCRVELYFGHADPAVNLHRLEQLQARRDAVGFALGSEEVIFDPLPHAKACRVEVRLDGPKIRNRDDWASVATWMVHTLGLLRVGVNKAGGVPSSLP